MEVYICQLCKEPIANFVCIECLAEDIRQWLPGPLSLPFQTFMADLLLTFHYPHNDVDEHIGHAKRGLVCSSKGRGSLCLYCYVNEVCQWLREGDGTVAERFMQVFHFGMKGTFTEQLLARPEPIGAAAEPLSVDGMCEECEAEGEVHWVEGNWVCEECREQRAELVG